MVITLLLAVVLVAMGVVLLAVKVIFLPGGTFPNTHVGGSKALKDKGIECAKAQHYRQLRHRSLADRLHETDNK